NASNGNLAPRLRRAKHSLNLAPQFNSGALTKSKTGGGFVKIFVADGQSKVFWPHVARLYHKIPGAQINQTSMIWKRGATIIPEAVFTKNLGIGPQLAFVENSGGGYDLEGGTRLHHVDDGPVFHLFGLGLGAEV